MALLVAQQSCSVCFPGNNVDNKAHPQTVHDPALQIPSNGSMNQSQLLSRRTASATAAVGVIFIVVLVLHQQLFEAVPGARIFALGSQDGHTQCSTTLHSKSYVFRELPAMQNMSYSHDKSWEETMPITGGFIWVQHNDTTSLEYGISMFHALHCLDMLRSMIQDGIRMQHHGSVPQDDDGDTSDGFLHKKHMPHCIGYIAQVSVVLIL